MNLQTQQLGDSGLAPESMNNMPASLAALDLDSALAPPYRSDLFLEGFGRARSVIAEGERWVSVDDAAKLAGVAPSEIADSNSSEIRRFDEFGFGLEYVHVEVLVTPFLKASGAESLIPFLLQHLVPDCEPLLPGRFTTASGQFVPHRLFSPAFEEIRAIVTGTTVWTSATSIAKNVRVPVETVIQSAGAGNCLEIQGEYLYSATKPPTCEVFVRAANAFRVIEGCGACDTLRKELANWIGCWLLSDTKLHDAGAVVSLRHLHRILAPASTFFGWLTKLFGRRIGAQYLASGIDAIPVTFAESLVDRERYADWVVWLLLRDGGVLHGGSVGETADEALVRTRPVFPDDNGQVSARALHAFLRRNRSFEAWLRAYSHQLLPKLAATKKSTRIEGDVLLSEEQAMALVVRSIKDHSDFRMTLTPSSKS